MIAALRRVFGTTCNEDPAVIGLDWTEPNWNVEIDVEQFSCLFVLVNIVERNHSLVELEEMDSVWTLRLLSWTKPFNPFCGGHRPLLLYYVLRLLAKELIDCLSLMDCGAGPAKLDVWLQAWAAVAESVITSGLHAALVSSIDKVHVDVAHRQVLVLRLHDRFKCWHLAGLIPQLVQLLLQNAIAARSISEATRWCIPTLLLLQDNSMQFNVAVIHNQVFCQKALQHIAINHIKLIMTL